MDPQKLIDVILLWANEVNTNFETGFVLSLKAQLDKPNGSLSAKQVAALENIYEGWHVYDELEAADLLEEAEL